MLADANGNKMQWAWHSRADSVLVMDSDPKIKANRLNLLGVLRNHARLLADFGAIVKGE